MRTVHECQQAVLWNGTVGLTPVGHPVPDGLVVVPLVDKPPSSLVLAWNNDSPLIRSFIDIAATISLAPAGSSPERNPVVTADPAARRTDLAD
ncbi:hypothetical protein ACWZHB_02565 [Nocardia sp. FBN12]|uniref:hypothetical protein n=1 Tax=Nocardia sp. FBN12 TaxID=3419766 RepID=UPI003D0289AE